jgi:hypothetical protein
MAVTQEYFFNIKMTAAGDQLKNDVDVNYLQLIAKGAIAGDDFLVEDGDGNVIWEEVADGANFSKQFVVKHRVKNLKLVTLDTAGAKLYVINDTYRDWSQR